MTVYISGKITGDPDYIKKFAETELSLRAKGYDVINPCDLCYQFLSYEQFMHVDFALIDVCDAIYLLKDWTGSSGARREKEHAEKQGKKVMYESVCFPSVKIDKKIRLIELFAGIGSQAMALRDIGADFEHHRVIEFDKYAVKAYNAIHGTSFEPTDICTVHGADLGITDKDKYSYVMTYSFPCQDLSVAGKQRGMTKGSGTRSGLLWEVERILKELPSEQLPDILLMENVPQVHAEKNLSDFESWQSFLRGRGYQNFYADLNARDFGIPQNRVRCFMVSILSDEYVDFEFPEKIELETVMKDYLEESVDEKYYINSEKAEKLIQQLVESGVLDSKKKISDNREQRTENRENYTRLICVSSGREKSQSQTVSRQDTTSESATCRRTEAVLLSERGTKFERIVDIACTLMARDYKGFGNQAMNGVIEWK